MIKVSVIVPIYNVEKQLAKCLDSLLNQTLKDIQIILVNDGSEDSSAEIAKKYVVKDPDRVLYFEKANGGLSDARNYGLKYATGEYISFVDSDDYIAPEYISVLASALISGEADISVCDEQRFFDRDDGSIQLLPSCYGETDNTVKMSAEKSLACILYQDLYDASAWGKMYRTCFFSDVRYPEGKVFEDIGTTYRLVSQSKSVIFYKSALYYYRQRESSLVHNESLAHLRDGIEMVEQQEKGLLCQYPQLESACACRCLSMYFHVILNDEKLSAQERSVVWEKIKRTRITVLRDKHARKKTRLAAMLSWGGYKLFRLISNAIYQ